MIQCNKQRYWVDEGFLARSIFSYNDRAAMLPQFLLLNGQPLNEPIVGHEPFVMNTRAEIDRVINDYQNGKMGHLAAVRRITECHGVSSADPVS